MLIIPLAGKHDRQGFNCGRDELDDWLRKIARQHQHKGLSKTFVAVLESAPERICSYYALTLAEVDTGNLAPERRRGLPRRIPGIRLGRLAVSRDFQGKGLGSLLLANALERVSLVRQQAGVVGLFVDAIDDTAAAFYRRFGFESFADEPLRLFLPV